MKKITLIVAIAATLAAISCGVIASRLRDENQRLRRNQDALLAEVELYRTAAGESAAAVEALQLRIDEFRESHDADAEHIRDLGIRLRRAESFAKSASKSLFADTLPLRDTVIMRDTIRDTVRLFESNDTWSNIRGTIADDTLRYELRTVDTLRQIVHRVPRKFWFIGYGTKAIRQEITSSNPHTTLVYTEYIELERRRKR